MGNRESKLGIPLCAPFSSSTPTLIPLPIHHNHHRILNSPAETPKTNNKFDNKLVTSVKLEP